MASQAEKEGVSFRAEWSLTGIEKKEALQKGKASGEMADGGGEGGVRQTISPFISNLFFSFPV